MKISPLTLIPRSFFIRQLRDQASDRILLTFDDGPHPETTPAVLQVLKRYGAIALFFVVGNRIHRAPWALQQIIDDGHLIGNHSYAHPLGPQMAYPHYLKDLQRCQEEILQHVDVRPQFHRPPLGNVSFASVFAPKRLGLRSVLWSYSSEDWRFRSDKEAVESVERIANNVQPRDILLFHDERLHTVVALERLLPQLLSRGIRFDPCLDEAL